MSMSAHNNTSPSCSSPTPNDPHDADLEPSTTNDSNPSTSSANTSVTNKRKTFPRFLVVEGLGANKTLRNVNSTILDKTIDGATSVSTKRGWMGRSVLVEVNHEAYFTNLMKLNQIDDMPVKVSAHRSLNYAKGVVKFRQAAEGLTNEDLARDLNMSRRNHDLKRRMQGYHNQEWQEDTDWNLLPHLWYSNPAWAHLPWFWKIRCGTIHPPPQALLQVPAFWPRSTHLQGHWRCLPTVLRHRTQARSLPKQRVSNMPKVQRYAFCCQ